MATSARSDRSLSPQHGSTSKTTFRLYFVIFWTVLSTFNFGFGTSELNPLQNVLSCPTTKIPIIDSTSLSSCISLTSTQFGYITALFTVGGFIASLTVSNLKSRFSILKRSRNVLIMGAIWNILGGLVQMASGSWQMLGFGRFVMGLGSGVAVATVPSYLNDISPARLKGSIGVMNQLSIVVGIFVAQALGVSRLGSLPASSTLPRRELGLEHAPWRYVPLISSGFALLQIFLTPLTLDSPSDLPAGERDATRRILWGSTSSDRDDRRNDEEEALLNERDADTSSEITTSRRYSIGSKDSHVLTISDLLVIAFRPSITTKTLRISSQEIQDTRRGTFLIIFTQMAQQLSGVNAVLYFSTCILSDVFAKPGASIASSDGDSKAKQIGLGITLVNVFMTFPPIPLIREDLMGRKKLFQISAGTMSISALLLSFALLSSSSMLAALSIVIFVAGFSTGLGPIPFLILPELVPKRAVPAASSLGLSLNWLANITVASLFLPLKETLAKVDGSNGGSIFFIFVVINAISFMGVTKFYSYRQPTPSSL